MDKALIAIALVLVLAGCKTTQPVGSLCTAGPIILDRNDQLTRATGEQIITLNNAGESICGWRAPGL